jgi:hypothetical protein
MIKNTKINDYIHPTYYFTGLLVSITVYLMYSIKENEYVGGILWMGLVVIFIENLLVKNFFCFGLGIASYV